MKLKEDLKLPELLIEIKKYKQELKRANYYRFLKYEERNLKKSPIFMTSTEAIF
jgi:hypothetical protein